MEPWRVGYSSAIGVTGGTSPYTCSITSGVLQAGLTLGPNCLVSGTPTVSGTVSLGVKATDTSNPTLTTNGTVMLTINPAAAVLTIGNPPPATVGAPYTGVIPVTGGTGPYSCRLISGTIPAGLTLTNCTISGTPITGGTIGVVIGVGDSASPPNTGTGPVTITINPAPLHWRDSSTIGVTARWWRVVRTGLPDPDCCGVKRIVLTTTGPVSITINPAPLAITTGTLPNGTVGVAYSSTTGSPVERLRTLARSRVERCRPGWPLGRTAW